MNIEGKLIKVLPVEKGVGKSGEWKRQCIIVEQKWNFNKPVCLVIWGDKINMDEFTVNTTIVADVNVESREHNGRWYSEIKAWRIKKSDLNVEANTIESNAMLTTADSEDVLPF